METQEYLEAIALEIAAIKNDPNKRLYCDYLCYRAAISAKWDNKILKATSLQYSPLRARAYRFITDFFALPELQDLKETVTIPSWMPEHLSSSLNKMDSSARDNMLERIINILLTQKSYETKDVCSPTIDAIEILNTIKEGGLKLNDISRLKKRCQSYIVDYYPDYKNTGLIKDTEDIIGTCYYLMKSESESTSQQIKYSLEKEGHCQEIIQNNFYIFEQYIKDYINSDEILFINFLENYNIKEIYFFFAVEMSKEYNPSLYYEYKIANSNKTNKLIILAKKIANLIETGIEEPNGIIRPFDIIDYYQIASLESEFIRIECLEQIKDMLDIKSHKSIVPFLNKHMSADKENQVFKTNIKSGRVRTGCNIGTPDTPINYYPTPEEEDYIFEFLENHNIPVNKNNYFEVLKRYKKWGLSPISDIQVQKNTHLQRKLVPKN